MARAVRWSLGLALAMLWVYGGHGAESRFYFGSYYASHMVLQQQPSRAVIWGYGVVGATVTVSLWREHGNYSQQITAVSGDISPGNAGVWKVLLDPIHANGPFLVMAEQRIAAAVDIITLEDVYFGDVWLCGGQSNMEMTVLQIMNASEELSRASYFPYIRLFQAGLNESAEELTDLASIAVQWSAPTAEILGKGKFTSFSAVCWLFGSYLYEKLQYPIGLVESCWGGTTIEAWSSKRVLSKCGLNGVSDNNEMPEGVEHHQPSALWNAMIYPLKRMVFKGAIWYQGEANTDWHQAEYNCTFPAMIEDWRQVFHEGSGGSTEVNFPFGFVQLSTYHHKIPDDSFPWIRWHQTADLGYAPNPKMRQTFMAVAMDLGDENSPYGTIHPRYKRDVAYRLYLGARAIAYGDTGVVFQGPFPKHIQVKNKELSIVYSQELAVLELSEDIFEVNCCTTSNTSSCNWVPSPIVNSSFNALSLSLKQCQGKMCGVRYAWKEWPCALKKCPIYDKHSGLPAPTFLLP